MAEITIPSDDPSLMKVFAPYDIQGMINALAFFIRGVDGTIDEVSDITGSSLVASLPNGTIVLKPTPDRRAVQQVTAVSGSGGLATRLSLHNPSKVDYKEEYPGRGTITFYSRDPSGVLVINAEKNHLISAELKVTDISQPHRIHSGTIEYRE